MSDDDWLEGNGDTKRPFDLFKKDIKMQDPLATSPAAKKAALETSDTTPADIAAPGNYETWFTGFIDPDYVDQPDMQAAFGMPNPAETSQSGSYDMALAQTWASFGSYDLPETPASPPPWMLEEEPLVDEVEDMRTSVDLIGGTDMQTSMDLIGQNNMQTPTTIIDRTGEEKMQTSTTMIDLTGEDDSTSSQSSDRSSSSQSYDVDPQEVQSNVTNPAIWMPGIPNLSANPTNQNHASDIERHRLTGKKSRQASEAVQRKPDRRGGNKSKEIKNFPSFDEPLPSNLTLEQICRDYPNHLQGDTLRRFVTASWTGSRIWETMQRAAKKSSTKRQGTCKMTMRLNRQRNLMDLEAAEAERNVGESQSHANNVVGGNFEFDLQQPLTFETQAVPATPAATSSAPERPPLLNLEDGIGLGEDNSEVIEETVTVLTRRVQDEFRKQVNLISQLLSFRYSDWWLMSAETQSSHMTNVWMAKAVEDELCLAQEHSIEIGDITSDETTKEGMLDRLRKLLRRIILAGVCQETKVDPKDITTFWDAQKLFIQAKVLVSELAILKAWTKGWDQELEQAISGALDTVADEGNMTNMALDGDQLNGGEALSLTVGPPMPGAENSSNQFQPDLTAGQSQNSAPVPPTSKRRMGRPPGRRADRMFPGAPSPDTPLSEQDLKNPDIILANYPEHLIHHHVMNSFLRPLGRNTGGYLTRDIVTALFHHNNATHGSDMEATGRWEALTTWVTAQRESARRARRNSHRRAQIAANADVTSSHVDFDSEDAEHVEDAAERYNQQQQVDNAFVHYVAPPSQPNASAGHELTLQTPAEQAAWIAEHGLVYDTGPDSGFADYGNEKR